MSQLHHPNPAAVPTLTEVIELLSPAPVADAGMSNTPRSTPPMAGAPEGAPIVTSGLASSQMPSNWTPMSTVVVPTLNEVAIPPAAAELPILTNVASVSVPPAPTAASPIAPPLAPPQPIKSPDAGPARPNAMPGVSEAQLTQRVLSVVQKQIDGMIEFRLTEAMAPILARHTEALVRELREELARTMGDVVARSVAQEMAKLRQR